MATGTGRRTTSARSTSSGDPGKATKKSTRPLPATQPQIRKSKTAPGQPDAVKPRNTVSLDAAIVRLLDWQARAESTNRAALTRKALRAYVAAANNEPVDVAVVSGGATSAPPPDLDAPTPRVTIQLTRDAAEQADIQARREETTRGSLTRKAIRFYLHLAAGNPQGGLHVVMLPDDDQPSL